MELETVRLYIFFIVLAITFVGILLTIVYTKSSKDSHIIPQQEIEELPILNVGDKLRDKSWGDTEIEIVAISNDKKKVKYKFIMIDSEVKNYETISQISIIGLLTEYEKL